MSVIARLRAAGVECYSRAEWGSVRPAAYTKRRSTHPMPAGPAKYHFLHITVTPDTDTVLEGFNGARKVESYGLSTPPMVSYHGLTTNEGKWFEGQSFGVKGTHTINDKNVPGFPHDLNLWGYAQAIMQTVNDAVTDVQVRVLAMAFAAAELDGYVVKYAPIYPHRKFDWKECPGDKANARLGEIQRLKDSYVRNGLPGKPANTTGDDMPLTTADLDAVQARAYKANSDYAVAFWVAPTGTGTAIRNLLAEMKLQLDRIEDDTDQMEASRALLAEIDKNVDLLAAEAQAPKA